MFVWKVACCLILFLKKTSLAIPVQLHWYRHIYCRTNLFKSSLFPFATNEQKKLNFKTRKTELLLSFRKILLKIDQPLPKSSFNIYNTTGLKLLVRLKLAFSHINSQRFSLNFSNRVNPLCSCSLEIESWFHFSCTVIFFTNICSTLLEELVKIYFNILSLPDISVVEMPFMVVLNML